MLIAALLIVKLISCNNNLNSFTSSFLEPGPVCTELLLVRAPLDVLSLPVGADVRLRQEEGGGGGGDSPVLARVLDTVPHYKGAFSFFWEPFTMGQVNVQ
jgi:hypothetical protein